MHHRAVHLPLFVLCSFLAILPAVAQDASESLATEARAASRAGRFREAALKFQEAAAATTDPGRRGKMELSAAYAYFNDKNGKAAREALERAFTADPEVEFVAEFFAPEFVKLVGDIRRGVRPAATPAPVDLAELKRSLTEKLRDGRADEVVYDLTNVPRGQLDREAWEILAKAYDTLGRAADAATARKYASGELTATAAAPATPGAPTASTAAPLSDLALRLFQGRDALARGDAFGAQAIARQILSSEPTNAEAYRLLGDALLAQGERPMAEANLRQAIRYDERNEPALLALFDLYNSQNSLDAALEVLGKAVKVNEKNATTMVALARRLRAQGDVPRAKAAYAAASQVLSSDAAITTEYAQMLVERGEPDAALPLLTTVANQNPSDPVVHNNLAAVHRWKSRTAEAEREYRQALRAAPDHVPALVGLATLLLANGGNATEAADLLQRASKLEPGRTDVLAALIRAQRMKGDLVAAQATAAAANSVEDPQLWNEAGALAYHQARYAQAFELFESAIVKDPTLGAARANREKAWAANRFLESLEAQSALQVVAAPPAR